MPEIAILDAYGRPHESRATNKDIPDWLAQAFGMGERTAAAENVTARTAMTVMTFFACVRNISEDLTKLPKKVRQKKGRDHTDLPAHPVSLLMRHPNPEMDAHSFWAAFIGHACSQTGGYAEIVRNGAGQPVELWLLDPTDTKQVRNQNGAIYYRIHGSVYLPQRSVLHLHGLSYDGINGYSIPALAAQILGTAIAMQKYTGSFFGNGANPSGILTHPATLSEKAQRNLREQFETRHKGSGNSHEVMTLEEGMTWTQTSTDPDNAQASELTSVTIVDICRAFRMPPHKVQHLENAHYANIEQDNINYATDTLDPWRDRLKSEIEFKLIPREELAQGIYLDINMKALMRGDTASRTAFYKELFYMGAISANDILELEDENPVEFGDRRFMQANLIPTDKVDAVMDKQTAPAPAPVEPADMPDDAAAKVREAFRLVFENKVGNILRVELGKAKQKKADDGFYLRHRQHVRDQVIEVIEAAHMGIGALTDPQAVADWYAGIHCDRSIADVNDNQLTTWQSGQRARMAAASIMEKLCNTAA